MISNRLTRMTSGAIRVLRVATGLCLFSMASWGCAYLPPLRHQFNAKDLRRLEVGQTTRAQAEERLRRYDTLRRTDRFLVCEQSRHAGFIAIFAGYNAGGAKLVTQRYRILAEFDSLGGLERFEVAPQRRERHPVPGVDTVAAPLPLPADTLAATRSWLGRAKRFQCVTVGPHSRIAAVDSDARLWLWDDDGPREPHVLTIPHRGAIRRVEFSPDGRQLACLSDHLAMFDLATLGGAGRARSASPRWSIKQAKAMAFSPDRLLVAAADSHKEVRILEAATGRETRSWRASDHQIADLAWSVDGRWLAVADIDGRRALTVKLWYLADRGVGPPAEVVRIDGPRNSDTPAICFSPDGRVLALNRGSHVELWNVARVGAAYDPEEAPPAPQLMGAFLLPYESSEPPRSGSSLTSLAFSPDSRRLAATNGGLVVYDVAQSTRLWAYTSKAGGGVGRIVDLGFDETGERLVAATGRGLYSWPLTAQP